LSFNIGCSAGDETGSNGTVSNVEKSDLFPDEFHRIESNGIVITDWAPQLEILKHPSIGGFVSHCGWNSDGECFMWGANSWIASFCRPNDECYNACGGSWQRSSSRSFTLYKHGSRGGFSKRNKIMDKDDKEGCVIRKRAKELKHLAERAWSHHGSSYSALCKIAH